MTQNLPIADGTVVHIHYTLTNDAGEVLDSSQGMDPLAYLHGAGNIIPGLENALNGQQAGASLNVRIEPEDAYGPRHDELIQVVPRHLFEVDDIQPGMAFRDGDQVLVIAAVNDDDITVDGNHPLAGQVLHFAVEVVSVRTASDEEQSHGHVHGAGGHHH